ncbi:maestro heat-like repeat-containing protein family member 1 [Nyctibius grandis]|uniref:maestro heat-like repeat-containing protein family member 1 n=1 Tax=Nyctibius grandis TaxID=48427 RepID=UPI0035BC7A8B
MLVGLPLLTEVLRGGDADIKMKVLGLFRNIMGDLERKEASAIAVQLVEELLPLFDNESSQLRELSMGLFRDVVASVEGSDEEKMKKKVPRGLLPLFFHMSDQSSSVAKERRWGCAGRRWAMTPGPGDAVATMASPVAMTPGPGGH